ncbi:hypothetical protein L1049_004954 [Liquidambar formosana]|uniref:RBR-type E3 ubiquitin transferase n=1 Tax=Liquidambar formosana TaxID=63359 RepID=A0AAP0RMG3_LIQFO
MAEESISDLRVDDFYFSALIDENQDEIIPVSDAKYAEELQLQEALMSSVMASQMANSSSNNASSSSTIEQEIPTPTPEPVGIEMEMGEPSQILCEICVERKESEEMFRNGSCCHSFCTGCISRHVATKIQDNIMMIACPGLNCKGVLEVESCRTIIPNEVLARWDEAISQSMIPASEEFYCPFKDCSAMLVNDSIDGGEVIRESECPICRRLFCAQCYVPWHAGVDCDDFQRLNEDERGRDDLMVRELAKEKNWMRCPRCKYYVEKTEGCLHITCRCKLEFCYGCGAEWTQHHGGCQRT